MDRMGFLSASRYTCGAKKIVQKVKLYIWVTSSLPWPPSWLELGLGVQVKLQPSPSPSSSLQGPSQGQGRQLF